ncbi:MAG: hypothetical protein ABR975_09960 [Vulcanimicrobiaceae bacterium]|jgi:hypothetical protein
MAILALTTAFVGRAPAMADAYFSSRTTGRIPLQMFFGNRPSPFGNVTVVHLLLLTERDERIFVRLANRHVGIGQAQIVDDSDSGYVYRFTVMRIAGYATKDHVYPSSSSVRLDVTGWTATAGRRH